ncbi:MAG: hypothetical protein R3C56_39650 [Pirellulaceae bacterium]
MDSTSASATATNRDVLTGEDSAMEVRWCTEATGYGLVYFVREMLAARNESLEGKTCIVSGAGNVAIYAIEKAAELGGRVVACSDSCGVIFDEQGIDVKTLKQVKEVERLPIERYCKTRRHAISSWWKHLGDQVRCGFALRDTKRADRQGCCGTSKQWLHRSRGRGQHAHDPRGH